MIVIEEPERVPATLSQLGESQGMVLVVDDMRAVRLLLSALFAQARLFERNRHLLLLRHRRFLAVELANNLAHCLTL